MVPTKKRNPSATYVDFKGEGLLFDCGEGTQRQMNIAGINRHKVRKIFITHWHADHTAGLLGLLQTMSNKEGEVTISIYGPLGTKQHIDHMMKASVFDNQLNLDIQEFDCKEVTTILEQSEYVIQAVNLEHGCACLGYSFIQKDRRRMKVKVLEGLGIKPGPLYAKLQSGKDVEFKGKTITSQETTSIVKGKKFTLVTDTLFTQQSIDLAQNADLLICEATYAQAHENKAVEHKHMTSTQAAQVASMANVDKLYLFHFSQRYHDLTQLLVDARTVFEDTTIAQDFMKIKV